MQQLLLLYGVIILSQEANAEDVPVIRPFNFQGRIPLQQKATAICFVLSSTGPFKFQWSKDGKNISNMAEVKVNNNNEYSVIIIDPVKLTSEGNYTCTVSNHVGSSSYTASFLVAAPPQWQEEPQDVSSVMGATNSIHCLATGSPVPNIIWKKITNPSREVTEAVPKELVMHNGTMVIKEISERDAGIYECEAENGIQPSIKKRITVSIFVPARFEEKFTVVTARKGESSKLRCEAIGDQPVSVVWSKEDIKLSKAGGKRYEIFETLLPKGMVSELIIRSSDREDGALYTCVTENHYGRDQRKIRLLVMEVPAPPLDVKVREVWSRSCSISWSSPYSGNSPITKYIIQYWRDQGSGNRLHEKEVPSSQSTALIKDLHPGTSYVLKVVAENTVGRGDPSASVVFHTGEEEPSAPPVDIMVESGGSSTIKVTWKPPPRDNWNGNLKGYYIGYKSRDSTQPYSYKTVEYIPNRAQEYFLTNLLKAADYSVIVKAFNSAGGGPASHEVIVRTLDGDLPSPPSVFVLSTSPRSITLRWNAKKSDNPVTGYTIYYKEEEGEWQEVPITSVDDNTYILNDLNSGKTYQLYITASNQYGRGDPSEVIAVRTEDRALLSSVVGGANPPYLDLAVLVPVAVSLLTIVIVITVACVCVRKIRKRQHIERALAAEKHLSLPGTMQRYVDVDKARPLVQADPSIQENYPSPYATMPMMDESEINYSKECLNQELKTFFPQDRPVYPKPSSLKRRDDHIYDSPQ